MKNRGGTLVPMVDGVLAIESSDSLSAIAIDEKFSGGVYSTGKSYVQEVAQSGSMLNAQKQQNLCSTTGWKWARREDAEWMLNDFITSKSDGKLWGLSKTEISLGNQQEET